MNLISTGKGADTVTVTGNIGSQGSGAHSGQNIIDTGAGDDTISLAVSSAIGVGSLVIKAGAGHDVLTLIADSAEAFNEYYRDWLTDLFANVKHDLEEVVVDGGADLGDLGWLTDLCSRYELALNVSDETEDLLDSMSFAAALSLHGLLGEESSGETTGSSQDLFAAKSLAGLADNGLTPEDTHQEPLLFQAPQALPRALVLTEDDASIFNAPKDLLGDMNETESLDSLFAQSRAQDLPAPQGAEQTAQAEAEAVMAAVTDINLQDTNNTEEMLQLIQGAFIS